MRPRLPGIATWTELLDARHDGLREAASRCDPRDVGAVSRLRRDHPFELVAAALELAQARRLGRTKFPAISELVADRQGVEQATSAVVASHKAERFRDLAARGIFDLCCGIGGDAHALARIAPVTCFDLEPARAWMSRRLSQGSAVCCDVTGITAHAVPFHLDPSRRQEGSGRRRRRLEDYQPGPGFLARWLRDNPDGAVKLGPGVDPEGLPPGELEFISEGGELKQAVLWCGRLSRADDVRTASLLPSDVQRSGIPAPPPARAQVGFDRYLFHPDPAVERAGLLGDLARDLGACEASPGLGLLTGPEPLRDPAVRAFEVCEVLPWRLSRIERWFRERDPGPVEVRTRGVTLDPPPQVIARRLSRVGAVAYTVHVLRLVRATRAVISLPAGWGT